MNILVISGSNRSGSESLKVSRWLAEQAKTATLLDLHDLSLPLYDDSDHPELSEKLDNLKQNLLQASAYVFVSPEWNGMMSLSLLNMLHYVEHEMAYKPVMLVGVSSGRGGTHPLDQMKLLGQKNRHYVISPENLVVSGVNQAFNDHNFDDSAADIVLKKRADYGLKILSELALALESVRKSDVLDFEQFSNGV